MSEHQYSVTRVGDSYRLIKTSQVNPDNECPIFVSDYKSARKFYHRCIKYLREEEENDLNMQNVSVSLQ